MLDSIIPTACRGVKYLAAASVSIVASAQTYCTFHNPSILKKDMFVRANTDIPFENALRVTIPDTKNTSTFEITAKSNVNIPLASGSQLNFEVVEPGVAETITLDVCDAATSMKIMGLKVLANRPKFPLLIGWTTLADDSKERSLGLQYGEELGSLHIVPATPGNHISVIPEYGAGGPLWPRTALTINQMPQGACVIL